MAFVSVTRLCIRSFWYLPAFVIRALAAARQAQRAPGFLGGRLMRETNNAFWTLTAWQDEAAMRAYMPAGSHRRAMPKLLNWCDEASVGHWVQESSELPDWQEAHRRVVEGGRVSRVNHPSPAQQAKQIPAPLPSPHLDRLLRPVRKKK